MTYFFYAALAAIGLALAVTFGRQILFTFQEGDRGQKIRLGLVLAAIALVAGLEVSGVDMLRPFEIGLYGTHLILCLVFVFLVLRHWKDDDRLREQLDPDEEGGWSSEGYLPRRRYVSAFPLRTRAAAYLLLTGLSAACLAWIIAGKLA